MISSTSFKGLTELESLLVLNAVSGLGARRVRCLLDRYTTAGNVLSLSSKELSFAHGVPAAVVQNLLHFPVHEFLSTEEKAIRNSGARVLAIGDHEYPKSLSNIPDPPPVLYVLGAMPPEDDVLVGIVGSRHPTLYGMGVAERFAMSLVERGAVVVSGLARGIDAAAHRGALKASGRTLGVMGCGLDVPYPRQNRELYKKMQEKGAVMSEFPMGTQPAPFNFPRRNRIVSGLSTGVIVVEARVRSGALITARLAMEQGRDVFAVPGRADNPLSGGPHALIRQGAKLVTEVDDIIEELPVVISGRPKAKEQDEAGERAKGLDDDEQLVWSLIAEGKVSLDELELRTGRSGGDLLGTILSLQIKRRIEELPGKIYRLRVSDQGKFK